MASKRWKVASLAGCVAVACAPALDWREFVPEGSGLHVAFPCRPDRVVRSVVLAGLPAQMSMLTCRSEDVTYAVGFVEVADPQRIAPALGELRASALNNVGASQVEAGPAGISGMTANDQASRVRMAGHLPDGAAIQEQAVFFTRGLHVYQAAMIGVRLEPHDIRTFFDALRFPA